MATSHSKHVLLDKAEQLFFERGYKSVTLDDIAAAIGVKKAALYYHVPGGKEDLFMEVIERCMERHKSSLSRIVETNLEAAGMEQTLLLAGEWLVSQPAVHIARLIASDLPSISEEHAKRVRMLVEQCLSRPLEKILEVAKMEDRLLGDVDVILGMFFALMEPVRQVHLFTQVPKEIILKDVVRLFLFGAVKPISNSQIGAKE